jgi:hypothetical protein
MTQSSRARLLVALMLGVVLLPHEAESQRWGISVGLSHVFQEEWALVGYRLAGRTYWQAGEHIQYGFEGAAEFWRPASGTPFGLIGSYWSSSGSAWLFEAGPAVRLMTGQPAAGRVNLFGQGAAGVVIISSNAEIVSYPVVPNPIGIPVEMMKSQAAPHVELGLGALSREGKPSIELVVKAHAIFVNPKTTIFVSLNFGLNF